MTSPLEGYTANIDRLDALHVRGLNDSDEADAVRDQMDCQWRAMTQAEQGIANRYAEQATEAERLAEKADEVHPAYYQQVYD